MAALKRPGRCRKPAATRSISLRPKDRTTIPPSLRTYLARLLRAILIPPHLGVALFRVSQSQQRIESAPIPRNLFGPDCKRQISRPSVSRFWLGNTFNSSQWLIGHACFSGLFPTPMRSGSAGAAASASSVSAAPLISAIRNYSGTWSLNQVGRGRTQQPSGRQGGVAE